MPYYIRLIMNLLPARRKKQFYILLLCMVAVAVIETATLGILSIFATSISSPEEVMKSDIYTRVIGFLGIGDFLTAETLILILSILVVASVIVKNTATAIVRYWLARFGAVVQGHVGEMILAKFLDVNYEWHLKQNPHDLYNTLNWRGSAGLFINSSLGIVSNLILVTIMLGSIVAIQPVLMPFMIVVLGLSAFYIYKIVRKRIDKNAKNVYKYTEESNLEGAKTIHGMKDVRIFGLEKEFLRTYSDRVFRLSRFLGEQSVLSTIPTWIMEVVGFFFLSAAIVAMFFVMKLSRIEIFGTLSLLAIAAWRVLPAINRIISGISNLRSNYPFIDKIYGVISNIDKFGTRDRITIPIEGPNVVELNPPSLICENSIEFDCVSFRYGNSEKLALDQVTCRIERGTSVGIIGHSGAGKSTFVDLFIGLLAPSKGRILVDGSELGEAAMRHWRRGIGYVPQFPYIYDCSLGENVAFADTGSTMDENGIMEACGKASIDFLDDLPDGVHSRIGERGVMISGGQRQRVAIARALYNQPHILVFDEATSSLDTKSENSIVRTIESLKGDQTMLIIAHRLSTVENCDYLIWLERGRVVDSGEPGSILPKYTKYLQEA